MIGTGADAGVGVLDEEAVVVEAQERVDRDGNGANPDCAPEGHGKGRGVIQDQEDSLFPPDPEGAQGAAHSADAGKEVAVGETLLVADDGDLGGAPDIEVGVKEGGNVVALGQVK
ncbi:MAG: hypothetical protein K0S14_3760 [Thermomicrobiales bacterium]|nr:hypothetical protein [Thermomicrobiales bacterium]